MPTIGWVVRLLQITVPDGRMDDVSAVLDEHELSYTTTDEIGDDTIEAVISAPVPPDLVEEITDSLRDAGVRDSHYIVVMDVTAVVSEELEALIEENEDDEESSERISREELHTRANELMPALRTYATMTAVSAIVATAGVLMDSAAVVVGSMVIAPLIGPSLAASAGTVLDDPDLFRSGLTFQLIGIVLAVAAATAFAAIVNSVYLVPPDIVVIEIDQVSERLEPDFLALAIALGAGVAGAVSLATGVSAALVGVMIAVALIPPAAVIGIGIAWGLPGVILGASVLLALNMLAINLSALGVLWYVGFRPRSWFKTSKARSHTIRRAATLLVAILAISIFLGGVTYASYQASMQEDDISAAVDAALDDPAYDDLEVIEIEIIRDDRPLFAQPERMVITVSRPAGTPPPAIADRIASSIHDRLDRSVSVEVRHLEREQST